MLQRVLKPRQSFSSNSLRKTLRKNRREYGFSRIPRGCFLLFYSPMFSRKPFSRQHLSSTIALLEKHHDKAKVIARQGLAAKLSSVFP